MAVCGNFVELIEAHKVKDDEDFILWNTNQNEDDNASLDFDVYIENKIVEELSHKQLLLIDATIGKVEGKEVGMLFIKSDKDKYGI
jgi:hypothetical protein